MALHRDYGHAGDRECAAERLGGWVLCPERVGGLEVAGRPVAHTLWCP